jgi:hypothetical protein
MAKINNVDIDKIKAFGEQLKIDPTKARKTQVIEREWLIKEGGPQLIVYDNSSINDFASMRSGVSKPSVNQL